MTNKTNLSVTDRQKSIMTAAMGLLLIDFATKSARGEVPELDGEEVTYADIVGAGRVLVEGLSDPVAPSTAVTLSNVQRFVTSAALGSLFVASGNEIPMSIIAGIVRDLNLADVDRAEAIAELQATVRAERA